MATLPPEGWFTGPAGMIPGQGEVGTVDTPWYVPGTGPGTFTSGEGQDQTVGSLGPESIPQDIVWRQVAPNKYQTQHYDENGLIGDALNVDLTDPNDKVFQLLIAAGMAGVGGLGAANLGAAVAPGLSSTAQMAIGQGLFGAGKSYGSGGNFADMAKAGLLGGATSYAGSAIGDYLPKDLSNTGIKSLDTALNKGIQSAAGSGVTSLLTGNKNILQDALMAGAGAAAGSGANSAMESTFGNTGLPAPATNILSSAALAAAMGKDPGEYALKSALGEITGAIKGTSPSGSSGTTGSTGARGAANINEEYDDNSSLFSNNKGELASIDTSGQRYVPGSNPLLPQNVAAAQNAAAEQEQLAALANQAKGAFTPKEPAQSPQDSGLDYFFSPENQTQDKVNISKDFSDWVSERQKTYSTPEIVKLLQEAPGSDYKTIVDTLKLLGLTGFDQQAQEETAGAPIAKETPIDQTLQDADLIQKDAAIPDQSSVLIQGEKPPSDFGLDFGAFAERPEATAGLDAAPQKVEVTGQTPDTELMRFLEANGLTLDEAQKVLVFGKTPTQDAGTDYNKFFELSGQEGPPTPKVVVQGQTPPKDTTIDDLMALLNQYDPKLDTTQRVDITGNTPKEGVSTDLPSALLGPTTSDDQEANRVEITAKKLLQDMGLDLGAYYPGDEQTEVPSDKLTDLLTQTVPITGTKVKDELDPNFFYQPDEVAPDKLTDDLLQQIEITGTKLPDLTSLENVPETVPEEVPDTQQVLVKDKLVDELPWEDPWMPPETPDTQQVVIKDKLVDEPPWQDPWMPPPEEPTPEAQEVVIKDKFVDEPPWQDPWMPPVEQPVEAVLPPDKPIVDPVRPIKPVVDPIRPIVKPIVDPKVTTTPGGNITIPGTTQQLHQELMQLSDFDLEKLLSPSLYAYHQAEKRKQSSQEDQMKALLSQLGYRI